MQSSEFGIGYARLPDGMLMAALRFENATLRRGGWPVAYPADKQTDVPLDYGAELPNPIPNHRTGGYAITLQFPPFDKVTSVSTKFTEATGKPVEFFLSDPEHPPTSFGQFGVICIPKQSLQAQHAYAVRIDATWKGKPGIWTWSFSTVSLRRIEASDDRAVAGAMNIASLVHGTVAHGGMRYSETVFLQLAAGDGSRYKMLSVIIPIAVWRQIAGTAEPGSFKGKIIEVQTTPQLAGSKYVNIRIAAATQNLARLCAVRCSR